MILGYFIESTFVGGWRHPPCARKKPGSDRQKPFAQVPGGGADPGLNICLPTAQHAYGFGTSPVHCCAPLRTAKTELRNAVSTRPPEHR